MTAMIRLIKTFREIRPLKWSFIWFLLLVVGACSPRGPLALFQKLSPHEQYVQKLKIAGLDRSGMGGDWLRAAEGSSAQALDVKLPYRGAGYFNATEVRAMALRFEARHGQKLTIRFMLRPAGSFVLFADLFQVVDNQLKSVASADSVAAPFSYEIKKTGTYLLRLQPELLKGGEYELTISAGPSLKFPVAVSGHPRIESFWGDSRDNGGRQHEGIDIFAPEGTPAVAAGNGTVTRVTENKLGGLVVFMRPDNADYNLYYAHLGKQLVRDEQQVLAGDTLGTIDHTGNAKNTPSHLHFGVYTSEGAVDPLPFVNRKVEELPALRLSLARLNDTLRLATTGEPIWVRGIIGDQYEVLDAAGAQRLVSGKQTALLKTLRQEKLTGEQALYDRPDTAAARVKILPAGTRVSVLAGYRGFAFVRWGALTGWLSR